MKRFLGSSLPEPNNIRDLKENNCLWVGHHYEPLPKDKGYCNDDDYDVFPNPSETMKTTDRKSTYVIAPVDLGTFDEIVERKWILLDELNKLVNLKIDTEQRIASIRKEVAQCNEVLGKLKQHRGDSED